MIKKSPTWRSLIHVLYYIFVLRWADVEYWIRGVEPYNFWQDFFDTYQSLSDWMKFAWLIVPPAFVLGLVALVLHFRTVGGRNKG